MHELFNRISKRVSYAAGSPPAFVLSILIVIVWAGTGPLFRFSDTWQLVINTGTTIATFLMVFLIQNTQNRDSLAIQLKLDELIRSSADARNEMIDLESLSDEKLKAIHDEFEELRKIGGLGVGMVLDAVHSERARRGV